MHKLRYITILAALLLSGFMPAFARDINIVIGSGRHRRPPPPPVIVARPPVIVDHYDRRRHDRRDYDWRGHRGRDYDRRRHGGPPVVIARPGRW